MTFNYKRDNKSNQKGDIYAPKGYDACQTDPRALEPLFPYLHPLGVIWEPATGEGFLSNRLEQRGCRVVSTDILTGQNFFAFSPENWDCLVTNPPYSIKYKWIRRCYELGKPFALLMPVEVLGAKTAQMMFREHGIEVIFLDKRINFKMPNKGWEGKGAQFPVAWYTWQFGIGQQISFVGLENQKKQSCLPGFAARMAI